MTWSHKAISITDRWQSAGGAAGTLARPMPADRLKTLEERTRYEPADVEARVFARWEEAGIFHPEPEGDAAENYSIAVPPPNVTGSLHMGHALNGSIQDALHPRARACAGRRTKWIYGTDHAGIATQRQVEKALEEEGTTKRGARPRGVHRARLGVARASTAPRSPSSSSAWAPRSTTRTSASRWTTTTRARSRTCSCACTRRASIYRDNYMVNWDPGPAHGDLRPRGRAAHGRGHALLDRLPARVGLGLGHGRHRAPRDDAGRHRDRREPGRRALLAPDRRDGDPAARRAAGCRSSPTSTWTPSSAPARSRSRPGHDPNDFEIGRRHGLEEVTRDRRGRPHDRRARRERFRGHGGRRGARRRWWPRCARRA